VTTDTSSRTLARGRLLAGVVACGFILGACGDSTGPVLIGPSYALSTINGHTLPFALPGDFGPSSTPLMVVEGSITFLNDSIAQRHEHLLRTIVDNGDSIPLTGEWTFGARYTHAGGRLVLTYLTWTAGQAGPPQPVETLFVSLHGLTLREFGFVSPPDSLVRFFCSPLVSC
jgi:hypothetical protein